MTLRNAFENLATESTQDSILSKLNGTLAVSGSFYQATQPVSFTWSGLTDAQLRASAVPVSLISVPLPTGAATAAGVQAVVDALGAQPLQEGGSVQIVGTPTVNIGTSPLPTGATTAALQLEMLSEMTQVLMAILAKLPRTDASRRAVVNTSDQGNVSTTIASGTVTTVTTAADVTRINNFGSGSTARPTDGIPLMMSRMGSLHLLNQIVVS